VDFLVSALLPIVNLLSFLFDHAVRTVQVTMPAVLIMVLVSSSLGFLAMKVDESQAVVEGWRLSERAIEWYAIAGGDPEFSPESPSSGTRRGTELCWLR
jgi:hypothetical protein